MSTMQGTIARMTAQRLGCKDEKVLKLIEFLAAARVEIDNSNFANEVEHCLVIVGKLDGKKFSLSLAGEAMKDFV